MLSPLSNNILSTLCYYDCLNYPLTAFEIWKYLIKNQKSIPPRRDKNQKYLNENESCPLADVIGELESKELKCFIEEYRSFYFIKGRKVLVGKRINKNKISVSKIKKLQRIIRILKFVPFVRLVAATGTLSMKNAGRGSDWDLLIAFKKGRIWTGRALVTIVIHLIGKRRHGRKVNDRVCLNYFITTESLEIKIKDLFSANEYYFLFPLFDSGIYPHTIYKCDSKLLRKFSVGNGVGVYQKFQLRNSWIRDFKPNYQLSEAISPKTFRDTKISRLVRNIGEKILSFELLENYLRKLEKFKIERNPKTRKKGGLIEASDDALIFLPEPQGPMIYERFRMKLEELALD
jgi:hypothetical protein